MQRSSEDFQFLDDKELAAIAAGFEAIDAPDVESFSIQWSEAVPVCVRVRIRIRDEASGRVLRVDALTHGAAALAMDTAEHARAMVDVARRSLEHAKSKGAPHLVEEFVTGLEKQF